MRKKMSSQGSLKVSLGSMFCVCLPLYFTDDHEPDVWLTLVIVKIILSYRWNTGLCKCHGWWMPIWYIILMTLVIISLLWMMLHLCYTFHQEPSVVLSLLISLVHHYILIAALHHLTYREARCKPMLVAQPQHLFPNENLIYHRYLGSSPVFPILAISIWMLVVFIQAHHACLCFTVQAQWKALCHLHNVSSCVCDHFIPSNKSC